MVTAALLVISACAPACAELLAAPSGRVPKTLRHATRARERERGAKAHAKAADVMVEVTARRSEEVKDEPSVCGRHETPIEQAVASPEVELEKGCVVPRRLFELGGKQGDGASAAITPALKDPSAHTAEGARRETEPSLTDLSAATLPNAPADIDLDCELEDEALGDPVQGPAVSRAAGEAAAAAAERARQMAQHGLLALSIQWSTCMEQARHVTSACRLDSVQSSMRSLAGAASRLVPPSPARKGLQTLIAESTSLWVGALWKILMLQFLVIIKTVISQGNVIARSFIQAACLEPTAIVLDSPMLQRQRSRTKALAAKAEIEAARARMLELQKQMSQTAETLREAQLASKAHFAQQASEGTCRQWSEDDFVASGSSRGFVGAESWWAAGPKEKHVSFKGTSGSLSPVSKRGIETPRSHGFHSRLSTPSQALLMSASRRTPLPASPLPPHTPAVN